MRKSIYVEGLVFKKEFNTAPEAIAEICRLSKGLDWSDLKALFGGCETVDDFKAVIAEVKEYRLTTDYYWCNTSIDSAGGAFQYKLDTEEEQLVLILSGDGRCEAFYRTRDRSDGLLQKMQEAGWELNNSSPATHL